MSHINEALKKAQKEKDTLYRRYRDFLNGHNGETGRQRSRWKLPAIAAALCILVAGIATAYYLQKRTGGGDDSLRHTIAQRHTAPSVPTAKPSMPHGPSSTTIKPAYSPIQAGPNRPQPSNAPKKPMTSSTETPAARPAETPAAPPVPSSGISPVASSLQSPGGTESARQQNSRPAEIPSASAPPDPWQLYERALAYQRSNNLTMAERVYVGILKIDPQFVTAMNNLGVIYMSQNKYMKAQQLFQNAVGIDSGYVDPYYNLACIHTLSGDTAKGIAYLKKAIALKKDVKNWAKNDRDLSRLRYTSEFAELMGTSAAVSPRTEDTYIVKKGDWIFDILRKHYGASDAAVHGILKVIKDMNPELKNSDAVYPGQKLLLPSKEHITRLGSSESKTDNK